MKNELMWLRVALHKSSRINLLIVLVSILVLFSLVGCMSGRNYMMNDNPTITRNTETQIIRMAVEGIDYVPNEFTVEKGRPVQFIVDGTNAVDCVQYFSIPSLGVNVKLKPGENVFEFTPTKTGEIIFTCSMGMVSGKIHVVEGAFLPHMNAALSTQQTFLPGQFVKNIDAPPVKKSQIIDIDDGGTYTITADLVALHGEVKYGYNGMIPGPVLKVKQGSTITINFTNNIDMNTTVHWHGLRHDVRDDGVPGVSQDPVTPGSSYVYTLTFPDAGIFWYHPHIREDIQQDSGLAASIMVIPSDDQYINPANKEELLILDDSLIENGITVPYGLDHADRALMGRFGNVLTINGEENYNLNVKKGEVVRFYLTNIANVRPFNISIPGAKIKLVASDLSKYEREEFVESIVIAPAERYTIEVLFDRSGSYEIQNNNPEKTYALGSITVASDQTESSFQASFNELHQNNIIVEDVEKFREYFAKTPDYTIVLTLDIKGAMRGMGGMMTHTDDSGIEWEDTMPTMNAAFGSDRVRWILQDQLSKKENMNFYMRANIGDKIKIRLINDAHSMHPMQHPIHLHGQRFLVISDNGVTTTNFAWKDTVLVPIGHTVDILVDVTNPGEWMMHCHIAEHLEAGMMTSLIVSNGTTSTKRTHE